jgi:hypothetical protein
VYENKNGNNKNQFFTGQNVRHVPNEKKKLKNPKTFLIKDYHTSFLIFSHV